MMPLTLLKGNAMTERPDDLVRVATGELTALQVLSNALVDAGISATVVGGDLSAGIGSALTNATELWVHRNDVARAESVMAGHRPHGYQSESHPVSDTKSAPSRGPAHASMPHRPLPD